MWLYRLESTTLKKKTLPKLTVLLVVLDRSAWEPQFPPSGGQSESTWFFFIGVEVGRFCAAQVPPVSSQMKELQGLGAARLSWRHRPLPHSGSTLPPPPPTPGG